MINSNGKTAYKSSSLHFWRLLLALSVFVLLFTSFTGAVIGEAAATEQGMKLPSKKVLAAYSKKYTLDNDDNYYYSNGNKIMCPDMNIEALAKLSVADRAKVVATMYNCMIGSFTSENEEVSKYIDRLGNTFEFYESEFIDIAEAGEYFKSFAGYMNSVRWYEKESQLKAYIEDYVSRCFYNITNWYGFDGCLDSHNQVLDTFTVIDGKLVSGSKKCVLICEEDRGIRVNSKYGMHHVAVYMVTGEGTIKYKSLDEKTGKSKTYKTKYISLASAIDKDIVKHFFTDDQRSNMLTIKSAVPENAGKIHSQLSKSKEMLIKIKAPEVKAREIIARLGDMVADINGGGYEFMYDVYPTASDSNTYILITEDYSRVYIQCAEFYKRLEEQYKAIAENITERRDYFRESSDYLDYLKYPDETERASREAYDYMVNTALQNYRLYWDSDWNGVEWVYIPVYSKNVFGYSERSTECDGYFRGGTYFIPDSVIKNETDYSVEFYSYEEFLKSPQYKNVIDEYMRYYFYTNSEVQDALSEKELAKLLADKPFKDLSDGAKLYAIDLSGLFRCNFSFPENGELQMVYTYGKYGWSAENYSEAMQNLLDGTADGVCQVFTNYEKLIFRTLGFECYGNSNYNINHAWTVLRLVNDSGKEMWIPFDYGIGPATGLSVDEDVRAKYLATEKMRYKLYLSGIKGAPDHKNFTLQDFLQ